VSCRFATYVQPTNAPNRIVKLDGQEPLQGAAKAAEAALQVGGTSVLVVLAVFKLHLTTTTHSASGISLRNNMLDVLCQAGPAHCDWQSQHGVQRWRIKP
jgi:hypothetical protein